MICSKVTQLGYDMLQGHTIRVRYAARSIELGYDMLQGHTIRV